MSMWDALQTNKMQSKANSVSTPDYLNVGGKQTQTKWNIPTEANPTEMYQGGLLYGQRDDGQYAPLYSRRKSQYGPTSLEQQMNGEMGENQWGPQANMQNPYNTIDYGHDGIETSNNYGDQWEFSFDAPNLDGWTYQNSSTGNGTDENPLVDTSGWYDAQGNRGNPHQGWGLSLGQSFGNNPESTFDSFWKDFGPLIMAPAAVATGGALGAAGWGSMAAGAGAGALTGGLNAGLTGGNILEGALGGGAMGGAMGGLMDWAGQGAGVGPTGGGGEMYADSGQGTSNFTGSGSMTDSPIYDMPARPEIPTVNAMASETGGLTPFGQQMSGMPNVIDPSTGMMAPSQIPQTPGATPFSSDYNWMADPNSTFNTRMQLGPDYLGASMSEMNPMDQDNKGFSTDPNSNTTFPGESTGFEGTPLSQTDKVMNTMKDLGGMIRDPLKAMGALHQVYQSGQHKKAMEDYMNSQQAKQDMATQQMQDYMDPANRRAMIEGHPGFKASQDFLSRDMQRRLARQGKFSGQGHGGAVSNNWAVPMLDVQAKNYQNFDNMMFGQLDKIAGQTNNAVQNQNQMAGGFIPSQMNKEDAAYRQLWKAIESQMEMPFGLERLLA